ncbi:uncharacterized protein LOC112575330 isoform X2 [Pomacea canaliculata]|uniref:uncharacterized protein LOC112575330 isoform X2 n=1 Tax=Pomacea canaliculata TaxID=400727 RepID=UPI000D72D5C2|nr:uncharacterized protein LOC112575330 isoform X2 [Pomacea canaliculata]
MAAAQKWVPPLPPGWEARWDPSQRKYYFIDHSTKQTTWEDPRWSRKQPTKETTFSPDAVLTRLHERFPGLSLSVIKDILVMCENDEAQAVDLLKSFESSDETSEAPPHAASKGASSSRPSSHSTSHTRTSSASKKNASHVLQPEDAASSKATSPRRQPAKEATPKLSHAEKAKLRQQIQTEFKDLEQDVIVLALESCHYDANKVRPILSRTTAKWKSQASTTQASKGPSLQNTSTSVASAVAPVSISLEPVVFGEASGTENATAASTTLNPSARSGASAARPGVTSTAQLQHSTSKLPQHHQQQQHTAKQVTRMSEQLLTTTSNMLNHLASSSSMSCCPSQSEPDAPVSVVRPIPAKVDSLDRPPVVTSQPQAQQAGHTGKMECTVRHGPNTSLRCGPNPSLCAGPNPSLLQNLPASSNGPNPAHCHGREAGLARGSSGAVGPNPLLRCSIQHHQTIGSLKQSLQTRL